MTFAAIHAQNILWLLTNLTHIRSRSHIQYFGGLKSWRLPILLPLAFGILDLLVGLRERLRLRIVVVAGGRGGGELGGGALVRVEEWGRVLDWGFGGEVVCFIEGFLEIGSYAFESWLLFLFEICLEFVMEIAVSFTVVDEITLWWILFNMIKSIRTII